ncbi:MAG: ferrous iron transport protein A [Anaerolineales bacterium]|nr:ferrous iron transport protein A [Anaerolineales bacterium]
MNDKIIPLAHLKQGESAVLREFWCGRGLASRLSSLGLTPGAEITMVQNYHHGPLIVRVRGEQLALGRGEARRILVQWRNN